MIPYGRQNINQDDLEAVLEVLRSDFLTQGPKIPDFERTVANQCGARHCVAVNSATSALHIACLALGLGPGDRLWTSPITFVASANCALYCGAQVDFVDIDPRSYNLCPKALEQKLEAAEKQGTLPKIVVPVHLCGQSCDMEAIHALSRRFGFHIIEDASHAIGARYKDAPVGNCRYSDIVIFSFHPVKIVTTGEGGMAVTNNDALAERMGLLRSHGITRDPELMTHAAHGPWYYQQIALGYNYRMTDIQAALGASQMRRLHSFVGARNELAARYNELLADLPLTTPWVHPDCYSSWHIYVIRLDSAAIPRNHGEVFSYLRENGIGVNLHYIPVHMQPYYQQLGFTPGMYPEAEKYYAEAITLPLFPAMDSSDQDTVNEVLHNALK